MDWSAREGSGRLMGVVMRMGKKKMVMSRLKHLSFWVIFE